jgi:arginine decarboxylase
MTPATRPKKLESSMVRYTPSQLCLTRGVGRHREQLTSFELALRNAGIASFNLVSVSSIFPPKARIVNKETGLKLLSPGEIVYVVMSRCVSDEPRRLVAASVGCALPSDRSVYGYLSEHHAFGQTEKVAGDYAEDLAAAMLASTLGVEFDEDKSWDEKREVWKISGKIYKSFNITQSAIVKDEYTTVVAAAVLVL